MEDFMQKPPVWVAYLSLGMGIFGLCAWFIPLFGCPVALVGLLSGALGLKTEQRTLAIVGLVLCGISMLVTLINAFVGAYLGATGQLNFPQF